MPDRGRSRLRARSAFVPLAPPQGFEEPQPHAGHEHLRVDEAGAKIEQRAGAAARHRTRQGEARGPGEEAGPEGRAVGEIVEEARDHRPQPGRSTGE